jgi:hypothetical protein
VLLIVAIARYDSCSRLAAHFATAAKMLILFLRDALESNSQQQRGLQHAAPDMSSDLRA